MFLHMIMTLELYSNMDLADEEPMQKKPKRVASAKQLEALKKAREARMLKKHSNSSESTPPVEKPKEPVESPIKIAKVEKEIYTAPPDAEPPTWFVNYVKGKVEEKLLNLQKNKRVKVKSESSEPINSTIKSDPPPSPKKEVQNPPPQQSFVEQKPSFSNKRHGIVNGHRSRFLFSRTRF